MMNISLLYARRMGRDAYKYGKSSEMKEAVSLTTVCFSAHRCIRSFLLNHRFLSFQVLPQWTLGSSKSALQQAQESVAMLRQIVASVMAEVKGNTHVKSE